MALWLLDSIEINGGFLSGLSLKFPRGLTCIIGPRGSGKSTLAEAVRYGLGTTGTTKSAKDLVQANLADAVITIRTAAEKGGGAYVVRRTGRQPAILTTLDGKPVPDVDLERGTFLPLDAYSSNEIEAMADQSLGDKRRVLLDELRSAELMSIQLAIGEKCRALDANRDGVRAAQETIAGLKEQIEELADARAKLAALPVTPGDDSHGALMAASRQQQVNSCESQSLAHATEVLAALGRDLDEVVTRHAAEGASPLEVPESPNAMLLREAEAALTSSIEAVKSQVTRARQHIEEGVKKVKAVQGRVSVAHAAQLTEFSQLQEKNLAASAAVQQRTAAEKTVAKLEELERQKTAAECRLRDLLEERKRLKGAYLLERERVSHLREAVAAELQNEAGEKVRIRVQRNADSFSYQQQLAAGLQGAGVRNHEDIMASLMRLRPEELAQLIQDNSVDEFESQTGLGMARARKVLESFREKIDPMQLEVAEIEDRVCIELNVASLVEPNFKDASELSRGQKCTALLPLLLARRETPLVVDQPEDNLDNHFIYETVVESVRRLKQRRQMVFITHNANIPVLGDADLVVVLDSDGRKARINKLGTLDECRREIIDLLEGGEEAFDLRRRRYGKS